MKISHSSGELMPQSLIGEGGESLLCEKDSNEQSNAAR